MMNKFTLAFVSAGLLALSAPTMATFNSGSEIRTNQSAWIGGAGRFSSWRAVGRDEFILWTSPSKPYLVRIWRPSTSLRFVHTIGVSSTAGRVSKFDYVIIDGQRYPIKSIVALDRETAKEMRWGS